VLILLPPSETKRDGGDPDARLDLAALSFPELTKPRRAALAGLREVSRTLDGSMSALKLGPTQRFEIERNRSIRVSPVMPAIERYTGVLYDALDVATLGPSARAFLTRHVVVHSALFGLARADDPLPAYRFSHDSRLPGTSLSRLWREANAAVLAAHDGLILDLRSESYVHLGRAPDHGVFLRVVTEGDDGTRRALNHFNKHGKGDLVRRLAERGEDFATVDGLVDWARGSGIRLEPGATDSGIRELVLVV
jgi:cytoplasmic iron level regulating protein YaaA (DUF328/UPF0246 family)